MVVSGTISLLLGSLRNAPEGCLGEKKGYRNLQDIVMGESLRNDFLDLASGL